MSYKLYMHIPFLPPSNNASYTPIIINGVARQRLSDKAKEFQRNFREYVTNNYFNEISSFSHDEDCVYLLTIVTNFSDLYTKSKTAKYPYKRKDVLWAGKLVQDIFKPMLDNDDLYDFELKMLKGDLQDDSIEVLFESITLDDYLEYVYNKRKNFLRS